MRPTGVEENSASDPESPVRPGNDNKTRKRMEVGLRVVRGPDWKWQNQDGGEGHVGTVVEIGKPGNSNTPVKTVVVQWDSGFRTNYRIGYQGAYDLRIFDNAPNGVKHPNIICDACKKQGIQGIRWKCTKCYDFDLCHFCYMNDKHDVNHSFMRFDSASSSGVKVPKRSTSGKAQSKGIFTGAKVVRGPDWDWGNQDGGEGKIGKVLDIRGWDVESGRSVANISWVSGSTNVYRLGHKGKIDLKYVDHAPGIAYYKDHLPVLGRETAESAPVAQATHCVFKVGDRVRVDLEVEILKAMQEGHGGWNPRMAEYVGKIGTVHRITERGDVRVQYEGCTNRWTFHPGALTKVFQCNVGDYVQISDNIQTVRTLQKGHGEWTENMATALGKVGKVLKVYVDGDLRVSIDTHTWTFNPACCKPLPYGQQEINNTLGSHEREERPNTLAAVIEQMLEVQTPSTEPEKLVREAAQGHVDTVREIIAKHADKVDMKSSGKSALQVAAHQGHDTIVKILLNAGANLELQDEDGDTALHYSAFGNQPEVTELLLQKGANVNALNNGGCSTLHVAVNKQHTQCVKVLIKHKCDVNIQDSYGDTALHDAIGKDSRDIVEMLINYPGIDYTLKNKRGFNVLHHAALKGNNHATDKIIQKSRQIVDVKKEDGFAALHLAALNGHRDVTNALLTLGQADIEIRNNRKQTPLLLAVSQGHTALIEMLVNKGASVSAVDEDGDSCLHLSLMRRSTQEELEESQAIAAIHSKIKGAEIEGHMSVAVSCFLLEKGASITLNNQQGKAPQDIITDPRVAEILRKYTQKSAPEPQAASPPVPPVATRHSAECMVCSDVIPEVVFQPCGHCIVCAECGQRMKKCFMCQTVIQQKLGLDGQPIVPLTSEESRDLLQLREMRRKMQDMEDTITCSICLEHVRAVAFLCGHSACAKCAQPLKVCHMCRKPITKKINLFN